MSPADVELVRQSFEAFNARDVDELVSLATEDCEWLPFRAQLEGVAYRGHDGVRRFVADMDDDWEAFQIEPLEFHDRGERVVVIGRLRALGHAGGVEVDSVAGFVFELREGRIHRITSHSSPDAALASPEAPAP